MGKKKKNWGQNKEVIFQKGIPWEVVTFEFWRMNRMMRVRISGALGKNILRSGCRCAKVGPWQQLSYGQLEELGRVWILGNWESWGQATQWRARKEHCSLCCREGILSRPMTVEGNDSLSEGRKETHWDRESLVSDFKIPNKSTEKPGAVVHTFNPSY